MKDYILDGSFVGIIKSRKREIYKTRSITMEIVKGHFHGNHWKLSCYDFEEASL